MLLRKDGDKVGYIEDTRTCVGMEVRGCTGGGQSRKQAVCGCPLESLTVLTKSLALVKNCLNSLATSFTLVRIPYAMSAYEYILGPRAKFGVARCHRLWPSHGRLTPQRGSSVLERSSEGRSRRHARRHARRQAPTHEAPHSHAHTCTHPRTHEPTHPRTHEPTNPRN